VKERAVAIWQRISREFMAFTAGQKAVTIVAALAVVIGGYLFASWASKPTYAPLFTNLSPTDASAIVDKLNSAKKPYKLASAGTEILVPQGDVYGERLTMSAAGLPTSGGTSGFSLLDKEGITTSEFVQHVDYQQALEGELDNTMTAIAGVQAAQVHLAIPDTQNVFNDNTQKTTAAVLLTTAPGTTLTTDQVRSVVNLVSSSVPGLTPDQVTVSDSTGKVLSAAGSGIGGAAGLSSDQTEQTQAYDTRVSTMVQSMLDTVLGAGHSVVTVNAQLDFDTDTKTSNTYTYNQSVPPVAVSSEDESYSNGLGTSTNAVLGAGTPAAGASPSGSAGNYHKSTVVQNNAVGTVQQTTVAAPGSIQKMGVSVILDKATSGAADEATVTQLVTSAVNLNTQRGDLLTVKTLPFDTSEATAQAKAAKAAAAASAAAASKKQMMELIKTGLVVLALAAAVIVTVIMGRRRKKGDDANLDRPDDLDNFLAGIGDEPADVVREPAMRIVPGADSAEVAAQRQAVSELADEQPDDVARVLRSWLNTKGS
jgi:flagellar M-ring protein FliF